MSYAKSKFKQVVLKTEIYPSYKNPKVWKPLGAKQLLEYEEHEFELK